MTCLPVLYNVDGIIVQPPSLSVTRGGVGQVQWANGWEGGYLRLEGKVIKQDPIPYAGELEFVSASIEGWVIDPEVHGLLDSPCDVVCLPTHCGEVVHTGVMACGVGMVID